MSASRRLPIIFIAIAALILLAIAAFLAGEWANRHANFVFGEKARRFQIEKKSEAFVLQHFGAPNFVEHSKDPARDQYHVLVYIPSRWSVHPRYCKITIDNLTGKVSGWTINSD